jgi:hypothetical protein
MLTCFVTKIQYQQLCSMCWLHAQQAHLQLEQLQQAAYIPTFVVHLASPLILSSG